MNSQVLIDLLRDSRALLVVYKEQLEEHDAEPDDVLIASQVIADIDAELATPAPIPDAGEGVERMPDSAFQDEFQAWWEDEGQYVRAGGGSYERSFAFQAWRHLMPKLVSALRASSGSAAPVQQAQRSVQEAVVAVGIQVEKLLCEKLGRAWSASGISIESLVDELASAPAADAGVTDHD